MGRCSGEQKGWGYQGQCTSCDNIGHRSSESRRGVVGVDEEDSSETEGED